MFRALRISVLLTILAVVAGNQLLTQNRLHRWDKPLWVTIYPLVADQDKNTRHYIQHLVPAAFHEIGEFIGKQAKRYGQVLQQPVIIQLARPLTSLPPDLPAESSGLKVAFWSLRMRWWVWRNAHQDGLAPADIRLFLRYQARKKEGFLERSVGIKNGSYGIVNAVASTHMAAHNRIVMTHEMLHVLGATDKYNLSNGQPEVPDGLANPQQSPLYPQRRAEIMSGRVATSASSWRNPATLKACSIGAKTALEIGW